MIRTYSELITLPTFDERFRYLELGGGVGDITFGGHRYVNQKFYTSTEWKRIRDKVILRDNGCDLGVDGYEIYGRIYIHHMNPVHLNDFRDLTDHLLNPEYLICVSQDTHNAIHYGNESTNKQPVTRTANDTCPWRH